MKSGFLGKFFKDMLTEASSDYDIARISMFLFVVAYIGLSVYMILFEKKLDLIDWAIGASTILGAGGTTVGVRARLEDHMTNKKTTSIEVNETNTDTDKQS